MCLQFVKLSGGLDGGSEPPSFQRAERERLMAKQDAEEIAEDPSFPMSSQMVNNVGEYLEVLLRAFTYPKHYYLVVRK